MHLAHFPFRTAARLASYKKPISIEFLDELPTNAAGKVMRRAPREPTRSAGGRKI